MFAIVSVIPPKFLPASANTRFPSALSATVVELKLIAVSLVIPANALLAIVVTPVPIVSVPVVYEPAEQAFSNALVSTTQAFEALIVIVLALELP